MLSEKYIQAAVHSNYFIILPICQYVCKASQMQPKPGSAKSGNLILKRFKIRGAQQQKKVEMLAALNHASSRGQFLSLYFKDGFLNIDITPSVWCYWLLYILNII